MIIKHRGNGELKINRSEYYFLTKKYLKTVYNAALCSCGNTFDEEVIMQDAFCALYQTDTQFKDDEHIRSWLIRVVINKSRNLKKSTARWRQSGRNWPYIPEGQCSCPGDGR